MASTSRAESGATESMEITKGWSGATWLMPPTPTRPSFVTSRLVASVSAPAVTTRDCVPAGSTGLWKLNACVSGTIAASSCPREGSSAVVSWRPPVLAVRSPKYAPSKSAPSGTQKIAAPDSFAAAALSSRPTVPTPPKSQPQPRMTSAFPPEAGGASSPAAVSTPA